MILDNQGRKGYSGLLLNYGFVVKDNDANEVNDSVEACQKLQYFRIVIDTDENYVIEQMSYNRVLVTQDQNQLEYLLNRKTSQNFKTNLTYIYVNYDWQNMLQGSQTISNYIQTNKIKKSLKYVNQQQIKEILIFLEWEKEKYLNFINNSVKKGNSLQVLY